MKLTKETLRRIIKEELNAVMSEIYVRPMDLDPEIFSPEEIDNIHGMIATGDPGRLEQARMFIDSLGGDPSYVDDYINFNEVGDIEKLGNEASKYAQDSEEWQELSDRAGSLAAEKAWRQVPHASDYDIDSQFELQDIGDMHLKRFKSRATK